MLNKEIFTLNPDENNLINDGVVEINTEKDARGFQIIRHELKTFVCEGEYERGLHRILDTYLRHFDDPKQPAVWVSGFFGSGKSHLVKMLGYLWEDLPLPNGNTARTIKALPQNITDLLTELDRKQSIHGRLSVSGTLKDFPTPDIRYSFLQLFLNALGLPPLYHHFKFVYWAMQEGIYENLVSSVEAAGKDFKRELNNMFVSTAIARAILELRPNFAANEAQVKESFKANFQRIDSVSREQFLHTIKHEILPLKFGPDIPATIIVLDEVQQFIGSDGDKSIDIQNLAQDLCSNFDGRFLLVGTGQNALSETSLLQRLQDRFTVKISLSDTDVETVTRKTVLDKKPSAISAVEQKMNAALGEISRNLSGTDYGYVTADQATLVADYPILPSTRKFWTKILQVIDTAGTAGQLRSKLRIVDESIKKVADRELGCIVPGDLIFEQKLSQLLQNALLLNETNNLITSRKAQGGDAALEGRILSAVFLIDQLPRDTSPSRMKSNESTIAELLFDNLNQSSDIFRTKVRALIHKLVDEKVLMPIGDEFKLQTKVGAEWEQEYTAQAVKLNNSGEDLIQNLRRDKIVAYFNERTKAINILQGVSRQKRDFDVWDKEIRPSTDNKLNLWVRDGWNENESTVLNEIRAEGTDAPLAYAYVKKLRDPELKSEIVKYLAADATLKAKGLPASPEGEQAKKSMETRMRSAKAALEELVERVCGEAVVYLAGGNKVELGNQKENITSALESIADRQFPDFKNKADYKDWDKALTKALTGDPDALKRIGWDKEPKDHSVATEILRFMGNGTKQGKEIRNQFTKAPYGWSQDAIDAMILMLRNTEHISTPEPSLNQSKIAGASFKKEIHTLTASDKIKLRKLYQEAGISCKSGEEFSCSNEFLSKLKNLAVEISGDAPKPEPINLQFIKDIENLDGNERLLRLVDELEDLKQKYQAWSQKAATVNSRLPVWSALTHLTDFATLAMESLIKEIDAIREDRLLLAEPDPVQPKLTALSDQLKEALNQLKAGYSRVYDEKMGSLQDSAYFTKLTPDQKHGILHKHQLLHKPEIKSLSAPELLNELRRTSLINWETKIAALSGQFQSALDDAIELSAPQAQTYSLPRKTITTQSDIDTYLSELKKELETLLQNASSVILK